MNHELFTIVQLLAAVVAPFTFTFCLIYAIREAVKEGERDIAYGLGAAFSLLLIVVTILLPSL